MECRKCYGENFTKDRCDYCGTHKRHRRVIKIGTKADRRRHRESVQAEQ